MTAEKIVETVKGAVAGAMSKAELIRAHSHDVIQTGAQTLQAAKGVVAEAGRQAAEVFTNTKDELKRTLKEGATQIGDKLTHIASATRKEAAAARKGELKARKQRTRAEQRRSAELTET